MNEHDPFNNPEIAHPRARKLMRESLFWDCTDESTPFGSDEGNNSYYEWRGWRSLNNNKPLTEFINLILNGKISQYNDELASGARIKKDLENPESAFLADHYDIWTLDATIIATGLAQLIDEGLIDPKAKKYIKVAVKRQRHPNTGNFSAETLDAIERVVNEA